MRSAVVVYHNANNEVYQSRANLTNDKGSSEETGIEINSWVRSSQYSNKAYLLTLTKGVQNSPK